MEPLDKADMGNAIARRLAKKGEGFYHLALVSDDVPADGRSLRARSVTVIERDALPGATHGRWLVHPKDANSVMIEGIEEMG